jgi:hypothetical protein
MTKDSKDRVPCARRWEDLSGDGARRFCVACRKVVHDLDALTTREIKALGRANPNGFCATYVGDENGAFRVKDPGAAGSASAHVATVAAVVAAAIIGCASPSADVSTSAGAPPVAGADPKAAAECTKAAPQAGAEPTPQDKERLRYLGYVQ